MKNKTKKQKRKLLCVGHPYFFTSPSDNGPGRFSAVMFLDKDRGYPKTLNINGIGAWQKVRVYLEWKE